MKENVRERERERERDKKRKIRRLDVVSFTPMEIDQTAS